MLSPLIVSLLLDDAAQQRLDELRTAHFPTDRLVVGAHVTLFHALPGARVDDVRGALASAAERGPFQVEVSGVRFLGRGVALDLSSSVLTGLRNEIAAGFAGELTRQDAQWLHPHVTVQNKVAPEVARALHAQLSAGFTPWPATARGLALWHYRGGPWEADSDHLFR